MLRNTIAIVIAGRLVLAPWAAAQEAPASASGPISAAAAREAATADRAAPARGEMHKGLKWTGIGLLLYSAGGTASYALSCGGRGGPGCRNSEIGAALIAASVATGVVLLHLADKRRAPVEPEDSAERVAGANERPLATAAQQEVIEAARAEPTHPSMPPGLKWTGVSLLGASLLPLTVAQLGDCLPEGPACRRQRRTARITSGAMAGTGALLLAIGAARRAPASLPAVSIGPGHLSVVQRVTF